jgi:hypothetical protein
LSIESWDFSSGEYPDGLEYEKGKSVKHLHRRFTVDVYHSFPDAVFAMDPVDSLRIKYVFHMHDKIL